MAKNFPNEIDWVQFKKQTDAMEVYLRNQRKLEQQVKRGFFAWGLFGRKKDDIAEYYEYCPPKGSYSKRTQIDYLGIGKAKSVECVFPGDLSDFLYQKWLDIASTQELDGFYVDPSTMLKLDQYEKHYNLQLEQQKFDKKVENEINDIVMQMIKDDIEEETEAVFQDLIKENK
ncbi:hypothetical protein SCRM01_092c [Synechococcus phage S-CRM01]|uniref:hypothetical protein n=1 Tax=Synechococcus phage S-CRM01 TaxID=1026955 RepID=UPI000209E398|nr:hypothetical protein SCRM01_092c [Synechococcus phage S-CRM01]AEC53038.1 hypothetical protein SCRM01_092c [Synechococcus phage S-CRM01]